MIHPPVIRGVNIKRRDPGPGWYWEIVGVKTTSWGYAWTARGAMRKARRNARFIREILESEAK